LLLFIIGVVLFFVGIAVSGSGQSGGVKVGNTAFSLIGSIRQTFQSTGLAITGERAKTPRDWIGWTLSGIGLVLGVIGLLK
jgi:uncharacterized membrane protein YoaK (UPF0700 family)